MGGAIRRRTPSRRRGQGSRTSTCETCVHHGRAAERPQVSFGVASGDSASLPRADLTRCQVWGSLACVSPDSEIHMTIFRGGCACGRLRYECAGPIRASFNCHCRDCQRYTGSAFMAAMLVPAATFKLTQGEPTFYVSRGDNGSEIRRGFCAHCGSPVMTRPMRVPDFVGVPAASLDDPSEFRPTLEFFTSSAQPWDVLHPETRKFARDFERE